MLITSILIHSYENVCHQYVLTKLCFKNALYFQARIYRWKGEQKNIVVVQNRGCSRWGFIQSLAETYTNNNNFTCSIQTWTFNVSAIFSWFRWDWKSIDLSSVIRCWKSPGYLVWTHNTQICLRIFRNEFWFNSSWNWINCGFSVLGWSHWVTLKGSIQLW